MLNDKHRIALVYEALDNQHQLANVLKVQTSGRLVQDVDGPTVGALLQLRGELNALRLTARKRSSGLAEANVAQTDVDKRGKVAVNRVDGLEEVRCLRNWHVEHLGDVLALVVHLQGLAVIASALTHLTRNIHVRQEVHLDLDGAIALACLTAPTLDVEGEAAGLVAANLGLLGFGKKVSDLVKDARVGCWVGTRGTANRALVYLDQLI